jgi:hypothetical protein
MRGASRLRVLIQFMAVRMIRRKKAQHIGKSTMFTDNRVRDDAPANSR